jgi:hypothetical protein
MPGEQLADLDELVLRCKGPAAKQYIAEAVACYKAGAYRACIVATWIAVVYDIIGKLRELELTGDKNAQAKLKQFEQIRSASDLNQSLKFEREILDTAKNEFELITPLEHIDLTRLQEDRNRCAHPSMNSLEETYQPSAELARTHLRNAIVHLLQHPPVQGKAALERLMRDVWSEHFPENVESAVEWLSSGPLARPRESLVRNFVFVLIKDLFAEPVDPFYTYARHCAALNAVRLMQPECAERVLAKHLSDLLRGLPDSRLLAAVDFLSRIPDTWQYLEADMQGKLKRYIENGGSSDAQQCIDAALDIPELKSSAVKGLVHVWPNDLAMLIKKAPRSEYADRAVELYTSARDYTQASSRVSVLIDPLIPYLESRHLDMILKAIDTKKFFLGAVWFSGVPEGLLRAGKISEERYNELSEPVI